MLEPKRILLASQRTPGEGHADRSALPLCRPRSALLHMVVVPDFWKGMMRDDWVNSESIRDVTAKYVVAELA